MGTLQENQSLNAEYERNKKEREMKEEIERLNKKIEQYENPEDMTLMFMWCDEKAKDEIKRLNNIINKAKVYCEDVIQEHENGEYNVSTTQLAIEEHKKNIILLLNILNGDLENYWRSDKE